MDVNCAAPGCSRPAAATLRQEIRVCVDHYWLVRQRLERLGVDIGHYSGKLTELLMPEGIWAPIAAALVDEAALVQKKARQLRGLAAEALRDSRSARAGVGQTVDGYVYKTVELTAAGVLEDGEPIETDLKSRSHALIEQGWQPVEATHDFRRYRRKSPASSD